MPTFSLSRANSIHFEIKTGTDTINSGQYYRANYVYSNIGTFFNREDAMPGIEGSGSQLYTTSDVANIQIIYDKDSQAPGIVIENAITGVPVEVFAATEIDAANNIWNVAIDWSTIAEGCYIVKIKSFKEGGAVNLFTEMDNGSAEANISDVDTSDTGNMAITRSSTVAYAGTYSARIEHTGGGPVSDDRMLFVQDSTAYEAALGEMMLIACFLYVPSTSPIATAGSDTTITWAIDNADGFGTSSPSRPGFGSDVVIIKQAGWNSESPSAFDTWTLVYTVFMTTSANTFGNFRLESDKNPASAGKMYVDYVNYVSTTEIEEAESEKVILKTAHPCTTLIEWTNDTDAFGIDYTTTSITFRTRLSTQKGFQSGWNDDDYIIRDNATGGAAVQLSNGKISDIWEFLGMTQAMFEKLMIASSHDTFTIDGVQYYRVDDSISVDFREESGIADPFQLEFRPVSYDMKNTSC